MNEPLVLTCEVESSLTPAVLWIRHGQPITPFFNPNFQVRYVKVADIIVYIHKACNWMLDGSYNVTADWLSAEAM